LPERDRLSRAVAKAIKDIYDARADFDRAVIEKKSTDAYVEPLAKAALWSAKQ
jgi:hypothetical protein